MINIFLNFDESDFYAKDMIYGYSSLNNYEDKILFETDINNIDDCDKILILIGGNDAESNINIKKFQNFNKKIGKFDIHNNSQSGTNNSDVKNWALPKIFEFCLDGND